MSARLGDYVDASTTNDKRLAPYVSVATTQNNDEILRNDTMMQIASWDDKRQQKGKKKKWKKKWKNYLTYSFAVWLRCLSLLDLVTDGIILRKSKNIFVSITLFLSIISPYILSYSSGVKLFLFRQTFKNAKGFYKVLIILFILPPGVLYFLFLDILDSILSIYRWILFVIFNWSNLKIKKLEETLAKQVSMDRVNYESFKRQRSVNMLMFETIPQAILQSLLIFNIIGDGNNNDSSGISRNELLVSIGAAILNGCVQLCRLYLEAIAVKESFIEYSLKLILGRVAWLPFENQIQLLFKQDETTSDDGIHIRLPKPLAVNYNIKYKIPLVTRCLDISNSIEFDFSSTSLRCVLFLFFWNVSDVFVCVVLSCFACELLVSFFVSFFIVFILQVPDCQAVHFVCQESK